MAIYLCHASALAFYDSGSFKFNGSIKFSALPETHIPKATKSAIHQCVEEFGLTVPLCVAAPSSRQRRTNKQLHCLVLDSPELKNRFIQITSEIYVAAPEVALLQVSRNMSELELIASISQLCSRFSVINTPKPTFRDREAVITKSALLNSIHNLHNVSGAKKLAYATTKAISGARSPAEVIFPLRISLPRRLSGFAIMPPEVNATVDLWSDGASYLAAREVDFLWRSAKLITEYDSDEKHGESTRDRDTIRANELIDAGYTVISATAAQVKNIQLMNRLTAAIATHVYRDRSKANLRLLRQFFLQPDRETLNGRITLNLELKRIYHASPWERVLREKQQICQKTLIGDCAQKTGVETKTL